MNGENGSRSAKPVKPDGLETKGMVYRPRQNRWQLLWSPRSDLVARGYSERTWPLWPTSETPPEQLEPSLIEWEGIAKWCLRYQTEMLQWARGGTTDPRSIYDGTLKSLSRLYQTDKDSPFNGLRFHVRSHYEHRLGIIEAALGDVRVVDITFREFKRWYEEFAESETEGGPRRPVRAYDIIAQLRLLLAFGAVALPEESGCIKALLTLAGQQIAGTKSRVGGMRFRGGRRTRKEYLNYKQAKAVCAQAHDAGWHSIALAQAIMFECGVRQKDVIGEWVPCSEPGITDIHSGGKKWLMGARWEEINENFIWRHRLSKSVSREGIVDPQAGKTEEFDLKAFPLIVEELNRVGANKVAGALDYCRSDFPASGPVIMRETTGRPWNDSEFRKWWRICAQKAGLPDSLQNRDSRPGAATEAELAGAPKESTQRLLGHSRGETTDIYLRGGREMRSNIAKLRAERRK